jgi:hypothetical protein
LLPYLEIGDSRRYDAGGGVDDDTPKMETAIVELGSRAGRLSFNALDFLFNSTFEFAQPGYLVVGAGHGGDSDTTGTIIRAGMVGPDNPLWQFSNGDGTIVQAMRLKGIAVAGSEAASTSELVRITGGTFHITLENMQLDTAWRAITVDDTFYMRLINVRIKGIYGDAAIFSSGSLDTDDRNDDSEFVDVQISAVTGVNGYNTDGFHHEGVGGSHKFVNCSVVFGRHAWFIKDLPGAVAEPGFIYISNGGTENNEGNCIRGEGGNHWMIANGYFSQDGDASTMVFTSGANNVQITGAYLRGGGRHGLDFNGTNLSLSGGAIYNCGRYSAARGQRTIQTVANNGGLARVTVRHLNNAGTTRQQLFDTDDFIYIETNTGSPSLNGLWKITHISTASVDSTHFDQVIDLQASTYNVGMTATGTARQLSACVRIGPDAESCVIAPSQLGRALDGTANHDYCVLIESDGDCKVSLATRMDAGTLGTIKYIPTTPPTDCYYWKDRWQTMFFNLPGAADSFYATQRIPPGVYAIVALELAADTSSSLTVKAVAKKNAGTYDETGSVVATTSWVHTKLSVPLLFRIGDTHTEVGIHMVSGSGTNISANIIFVRIADS